MRKPKWMCLNCWLGSAISHEFNHSPSIALMKSFEGYDSLIKEALERGAQDARRELDGDS